jgi:hypothetical protein
VEIPTTSNRSKRFWFILAAWLFGIFFLGPGLHAASTTFSPEVDLYLTHNNIFRSRLIAGMNYTDTEGRWASGLFEYSLDFGLKSFFRRYVYKDPNAEKNKIITLRLGYAYLPDFNHDEEGADENRMLLELTARLPMGGKWLWTDRNRGEFRSIGDDTSKRYRNRLRLERGIVVMGFRGTPYLSFEGYYDTRVNRWNLFESRFGIEFPWHYSVVFEPYFAHQAIWEGQPREIIGFVVQKHAAMPLGGTQ